MLSVGPRQRWTLSLASKPVWAGSRSHSVSFCPKQSAASESGQLVGLPPTGFVFRPSFFSSRRLCYHLLFTRRKLRQGAGAPWVHTPDPGGLGHQRLRPAVTGPVWV